MVEHLQELGLSVYGPYVNFDMKEQLGGCMDYDVDAILKYRKIGPENFTISGQ